MDDDRPTMLLVGGAGAPGLGVDVAVSAMTEARSRGFRIHLMNHPSLLAPTAEACDLADQVSAVDPEDTAAATAWARQQVAAGARFDVVFCVREFSLQSAAEIAADIGAAGNPPEVVRRIRTKDACRAWLADAGFRQPAVWVCADAGEARARATGPGPWVVKPRSGGGSEGVSLVRDPGTFAQAIAVLPAGARPFLVEEYVSGREFSVEGLFLHGKPRVLAITAKEKLPPPFFVEIGHTMPADLPAEVQHDIEETVGRALQTLGVCFGLFHVELWLTDDGIVLGELHGRLGGDYIHRLLAFAIPGVAMFGRVMDDALGRPSPPFDGRCVRGAATRYLTPPPGRVLAIEGWDEASAHPAVIVHELRVGPGDTIVPPRSSDDRVGALVVGGDTAREAGQLADRLAASVRFVVDE